MWGRNQKEKFNQRIAEDKAKSIIHSKTLLDFKRKRNYVRSLGFSIALEDEKKRRAKWMLNPIYFIVSYRPLFGGGSSQSSGLSHWETRNYRDVNWKLWLRNIQGVERDELVFFLPVERFTFPPEEKEKRKKEKASGGHAKIKRADLGRLQSPRARSRLLFPFAQQ